MSEASDTQRDQKPNHARCTKHLEGVECLPSPTGEHAVYRRDDGLLACRYEVPVQATEQPELRGTCGSWCNGCDECQPEQPYTDEQADELAASMRDTTSTRCLPDCQGDCPVCLPPEEYDKLHGKTTNTATLSSVLHYEAGQADERARIERIVEAHANCASNRDLDFTDLLAAIRGGDDA